MLPWVTCSAALSLSSVKRAPRPWCLHASAAPDRAAWQAADSGIPPAQVEPALPGHSGTAQLNLVPAGSCGHHRQLEISRISGTHIRASHTEMQLPLELIGRLRHVLFHTQALHHTQKLPHTWQLHASQRTLAESTHLHQRRREANGGIIKGRPNRRDSHSATHMGSPCKPPGHS